MVQEEILEGSLLYHAVYGLCRVHRLVKQTPAGEEVASYLLMPKKINHMKTRITIAAADMETSGFHSPISVKEANEILEYLTTGDSTSTSSAALSKTHSSAVEHNEIWDMAQTVFSYEKTGTKDRVKRQVLEYSIKGIVGEFAHVFNITLKKSAEKVQKSLGSKLKVDSLTFNILTDSGERGSIAW